MAFIRSFYFLCFVAGSFCALAMAPYNFWPVLLVGFGTFYVALHRAEKKRHAFTCGWLFGFGYFVFSLYWIGNALLVDGNPYVWAWPLAVCGLPALLAFYTAFPALICSQFLKFDRWHGYLGFIAIFAAFEWLRGHLFTGFPWNLFGYAWADMLPVVQIISLGNVYILSVLTLLWLSIGGLLWLSKHTVERIALLVLVLVSFAVNFSFGMWRLSQDSGAVHDTLMIKIVQPNTPQDEKWEREKMVQHFYTALELSQHKENEPDIPTLIVWPETALSPGFIYQPEIAAMLNTYSKDSVQLITGALRHTPEDDSYHNSVITISQDGSVSNIYDKTHLVPFGEYIPFQKWIPLRPVAAFKGFDIGAGLQSLTTFGGLTYSPLVCYEIIFPGKMVARGTHPDFIVNVTNDGWYGISLGPYQHFVKAQFRAIEEGIPVIRAANTGFSGVIDPYGRVVARSDLYKAQDLLVPLPHKISF